MSTHSILSRLRAGTVIVVFSILAGLLLTLQPVLSTTSFATSARPVPSPGYQFGVSQAMDLASVSVVRLAVTYGNSSSSVINPSTPATPTGIASGITDNSSCSRTGLGTIVSSTGTAGNVINYVLTDSFVVTSATIKCSLGNSSISKIQIYANSVYTSNGASPLPLITCTSGGTTVASCNQSPIICQNSPCSGAVLFTFKSQYFQPYLKTTVSGTPETGGTPIVSGKPTATGTQGAANTPFGIELSNSATAYSGPPPTGQELRYLIPTQIKPVSGSSSSFEPGMPLVNADGTDIADMVSSTSQSSGSIVSFANNIITASVPSSATTALQSDWIAGVQAYHSTKYTTAENYFKDAEKQNPNFQAAATFAALAANKVKPVSTVTPTRDSNAGNDKNGFFGVPFWLLAVIGLIIVVILLALVMLLGRRRGEMARFKKDTRAADRRAEQDAMRIKMEEEARQAYGQSGQSGQVGQARQVGQSGQPASPYASPVSGQVLAAGAGGQAARELRCPHCGCPYVAGNTQCPNCGALLSPSESGLNVRMVQPPPAPPQLSPSPQQQMPPVPNIQSPVLMPSSISDQPTLEMSPSQQSLAEETTAPGPRKAPRFNGHNINLAVGSGSDPGIKRKQKPNEDSVLVFTGERTHNSLPQQFGLFVVADGMGGHANGQDASRLAIQTMVDRILPKLSSSEELDDTKLAQLLVDGVQQANNAVYERNMEHHADMGTTMTSAVVVGSVAHVANVGDSRTYMYREAEGLHKITHDHSVVASLVEAGIIKGEDVYTHPKRNQIYRSLGEKPVVDVDHFTVELQPGDKLLLCSDGLWEMVRDRDPQRDQDIERILSMHVSDPKQTVNALIKAANNGGGEDNISVIVVNATESTTRTGMTGVYHLDKPETVRIPQM